MLGITPNGVPEPDLLGWELKAHSGSGRITLMTPEPTVGIYAANYVDFMRQYGRSRNNGRIDFAGTHYCGQRSNRTGLTLRLNGFDPTSRSITDPEGGLSLLDDNGELAAGWTFADLMAHWARKHANTAFMRYQKDLTNGRPRYRYGPEVTTAQGSPFERYLAALHAQTIIYDPGCKLEPNVQSRSGWNQKKRNQFRISWSKIDTIYETITHLDLSQ